MFGGSLLDRMGGMFTMLLGGIFRGLVALGKAIWNHPVLRLFVLLLAAAIFCGALWWPAVLHPTARDVTPLGVAGVAALGWLLIVDTAHHLWPFPWLGIPVRMGYAVAALPVIRVLLPLWAAAPFIAVLAAAVGIGPWLLTARRGVVRS